MDNEIKNSIEEGTQTEAIEQDASVTTPVDQVNEVSTPQPTSSTTEKQEIKKENKFLSFLKSWKVIPIFAAILIVAVVAIIYLKKVEEEREYEKNLKEFVIESGKASMGAAYICDDLRKIWQEYIFDDKKYFNPSTGQFSKWNGSEYCSDFSEAVNRKIRWNDESKTERLIKRSYKKANRLYKDLTPAPDKYKDIHVYVKQMYKAMQKLYSQSTNPTGSLSTYSSACNEAVEEYTSALSDLSNESNIDFSETKSDDED